MLKKLSYAAAAALMLAGLYTPVQAGNGQTYRSQYGPAAAVRVDTHSTPPGGTRLRYQRVKPGYKHRIVQGYGGYDRIRRPPPRPYRVVPHGRPRHRADPYRPATPRHRANPYRPDRPGNYEKFIPPSAAIGAARGRAPGRLLGLRRENRLGRPVYVVKFRDAYSVHEVIIDARSGQVLR